LLVGNTKVLSGVLTKVFEKDIYIFIGVAMQYLAFYIVKFLG